MRGGPGLMGVPPAKKEEIVEEASPDLDESTRVRSFRGRLLLDRGFNLEQILRLVNRPDVVHDVDRLLEKGAPLEFVVDELADD